MSSWKRLKVEQIGSVCIVSFNPTWIADPVLIREIGQELTALLAQENRSLLIDCSELDHLNTVLSKSMLSKLKEEVIAAGGALLFFQVLKGLDVWLKEKGFIVRESREQALDFLEAEIQAQASVR